MALKGQSVGTRCLARFPILTPGLLFAGPSHLRTHEANVCTRRLHPDPRMASEYLLHRCPAACAVLHHRARLAASASKSTPSLATSRHPESRVTPDNIALPQPACVLEPTSGQGSYYRVPLLSTDLPLSLVAIMSIRHSHSFNDIVAPNPGGTLLRNAENPMIRLL